MSRSDGNDALFMNKWVVSVISMRCKCNAIYNTFSLLASRDTIFCTNHQKTEQRLLHGICVFQLAGDFANLVLDGGGALGRLFDCYPDLIYIFGGA